MSTLVLSGPGFFLEVPKKYTMIHCIISYSDSPLEKDDDEPTPVHPGRYRKIGYRSYNRKSREKKSLSDSTRREARIEITIRYREGNSDVFTDNFYSSYDSVLEVKKLYNILIKQIAEQHDVMHLVKLYHQDSQQLALGMIGDEFERTIAEQVYRLTE
jgi:hypothetical protein